MHTSAAVVAAVYTEREFTERNFNFRYLLREDPQQLRVGHSVSVFISFLDAIFYFYVTVGIKASSDTSFKH